jgi:siroheme synthase
MLDAKKVYLVGAGPGDPGLLTVKGRDLLAVADCVIYDNLVNPEILRFVAKGAELIYAGKRCGSCAMRQEATGVDTLVLFMGVSRIREIANYLLRHGRCAETPVAVIRLGTYAQQEVYTSDLQSIADLVEINHVKSPAIILIGEVVRLRERLNWFANVVTDVALDAA